MCDNQTMPSLFSRVSGTPHETPITISARTFMKVVLLVIATMFVLTFLSRLSYVFTLIMIALFLALALSAPVNWMTAHFPGKLRNNRALATAISFLVLILLATVFLVNVVPPVIHQTEQFITRAPQTIQNLRTQYHSVDIVIVRYHLQSQVDQLTNEITSRLRSGTGTVIAGVTGLLSSIVATLTILALTFMLLNEGPFWIKFFEELLPNDRRAHARMLSEDMYRVVRGYINGQVILALIAGVFILPGFLIFHIPYPFALMALVFICALIPMVGHTIGASIVSAIALFHSPFSALGILIYYILYQQIENYLVQPRLQASVTNLSPLLVLLGLLLGFSFAGLLGGLVGIPIVACLRVWLVDYLRNRQGFSEDMLPGVDLGKEKV
jgi:predicted PurR-regulated permease PerM